jgi:hypothetical protein
MAIDNPLLGVGPGNWPEVYPDYAVRNDPSMARSAPGTTANPWPSSDWVAYIAERGFPAAALLILAVAGIGISTARRLLAARDADEAILAAGLLATLAAALVAGMFDAVLLLAAPTLLIWAALGALWSPQTPVPEESVALAETAPPRPWATHAKTLLLLVVAVGAGVGATLSLLRLLEM